METGSKIDRIDRDPSFDNERLRDCHAIFGLRPQGVSIFILDEAQKNILATAYFHWSHVTTADDLLSSLEERLLAEKLDFDKCLSVNWCISFPKISLIPADLFSKDHAPKILSHSSKIAVDEHVLHDLWQDEDIVAIYAIPLKVREWISLYFPDARLLHSSTSMKGLSSCYSTEKTFSLLSVYKNTAELFISSGKRTLFYNQFSYEAEDDLLYYLLYAFEQSGILAPEARLRISGIAGKNSKLQKILSDYVGSVEEAGLPFNLVSSPVIPRSEILKNIHLSGII